jgi:hypothetical protein
MSTIEMLMKESKWKIMARTIENIAKPVHYNTTE